MCHLLSLHPSPPSPHCGKASHSRRSPSTTYFLLCAKYTVTDVAMGRAMHQFQRTCASFLLAAAGSGKLTFEEASRNSLTPVLHTNTKDLAKALDAATGHKPTLGCLKANLDTLIPLALRACGCGPQARTTLLKVAKYKQFGGQDALFGALLVLVLMPLEQRLFDEGHLEKSTRPLTPAAQCIVAAAFARLGFQIPSLPTLDVQRVFTPDPEASVWIDQLGKLK